MTKNMLSLFKGFVPTKDKECQMKFKNVPSNELLSYNEAQKYNEFAGILAPNTVLYNPDDEERANILSRIVQDKKLKFAINKTTRGKHFCGYNNDLLTTCKTHCTLACGLVADIKIGSKNSYSVLKFDGKERITEFDIADGEDYQKFPKWMLPIKSNRKLDFLNMEAGDGRNQALFDYILTLQSNNFSKDEARETIRILNKYVLKGPLKDSELETILRDDAFKKAIFFQGSTFLFDKFAAYLKSNDYVIKANENLLVYQDGVYVIGQDELSKTMRKYIPNIKRTQKAEVLDCLNDIADNAPIADAQYW